MLRLFLLSFIQLSRGFLFPIPLSTLYVVIGATLGALIIFLSARTAFGEFFQKKAGTLLKKMEKGFQENAWSYLLFLRFVPLFPFWLVNIAAAFFQVRVWIFVWTTIVGIIPGAYVYTQAGAGIGAVLESNRSFSFSGVFNAQMIVSLILLGILLFALFIVKKFMLKRH